MGLKTSVDGKHNCVGGAFDLPACRRVLPLAEDNSWCPRICNFILQYNLNCECSIMDVHQVDLQHDHPTSMSISGCSILNMKAYFERDCSYLMRDTVGICRERAKAESPACVLYNTLDSSSIIFSLDYSRLVVIGHRNR